VLSDTGPGLPIAQTTGCSTSAGRRCLARSSTAASRYWENEAALEKARQAVAAELEKQKFNPQELMKTLEVKVERGIYERFPY
jgi:hypothetical protein